MLLLVTDLKVLKFMGNLASVSTENINSKGARTHEENRDERTL